MRKYYVRRNRTESMIELIGDVIELVERTAAYENRDMEGIREMPYLRKPTVARLKEIFLKEVEEEEEG